MDKRKCLMNIKLLLNDDDTICLGVQETKINAKFTISKKYINSKPRRFNV